MRYPNTVKCPEAIELANDKNRLIVMLISRFIYKPIFFIYFFSPLMVYILYLCFTSLSSNAPTGSGLSNRKPCASWHWFCLRTFS